MKATEHLKSYFLPRDKTEPALGSYNAFSFRPTPMRKRPGRTEVHGWLNGSWQHYRTTDLCCIFVLVLACLLAGCTTKSKAKQKERAAYMAGREQAERMMQSRTNVTVIGPVRNQVIPWTEDLTLAKALVVAEYTGRGTPQEILVVRNGVAQRVDPNDLLAGRDIPLLQGDLIQIR
jgi:hypothetical protein